MVRPTTLGTLQCPSSFNGSGPFKAKETHTISSMLDDLQLDITLRIHEQINEFLSLALPSLTQEPLRRTDAFGGKGEEEEVAAQRQAKKWDKNSPPPPYLRKRRSG